MTIIHQHDYSSRYYPAMPMVTIQVSRRIGETPITLDAIVDSGSDATMMPLNYLRQLAVRKASTSWLSGTAGGRIEVDLYTAVVKLGSHDPIYVDIVGTHQTDEVILGRDILNQFVVNLNGLAQVVEIITE